MMRTPLVRASEAVHNFADEETSIHIVGVAEEAQQ